MNFHFIIFRKFPNTCCITLCLLRPNADSRLGGWGTIGKRWTSVLQVRARGMPVNELFPFPDWATAKDAYGIDRIDDFSYIYSSRGWRLS